MEQENQNNSWMSKNVKHVPSKPKISSLQILEVVNVFVRTKLFKALHSYAFSCYCTWLHHIDKTCHFRISLFWNALQLLENSLLIQVSGNCYLWYATRIVWQELFEGSNFKFITFQVLVHLSEQRSSMRLQHQIVSVYLCGWLIECIIYKSTD